MNPKSTLTLAASICFTVLAIQPQTAGATAPMPVTPRTVLVDKPGSAARLKASSRNNNAVKIYPALIQKAMHVVAKENDGKQIDFFVFDLEGTLLKHYKMTDGDHKKISGLERGRYIYHVFCGDDETATGKFEIR